MLNSLSETDAVITLGVDYNRSIQEMIKAGNYGAVDAHISSENYFILPEELIGKKIEVVGKLFNFSCPMGSEEVILEMRKVDYRPAIFPELMALGELRKNLQKRFPIVALASVWVFTGEEYNVPVLSFDAHGRKLTLDLFDFKWIPKYYFLGIQEDSSLLLPDRTFYYQK